MATTAKTRAKRHTHVKRGWDSHVPIFNIMDYNASMMRTLAYFSSQVDSKEKQKLTIQYWKSQKRDVEGFDKISDGYFHQAAVLAYLSKNNVSLEDRDIAHLTNFYHNIKSLVEKKNEEQSACSTQKIRSVRDNTNEIIQKHLAHLDSVIDDYAFNGESFDISTYVKANELKPQIIKAIADGMKPYLIEFKEAYQGADEQLIEGYSHFGKRGLKKMIDFVQAIIDGAQSSAIITKTTRKPRTRKEKPAGVIASKVKFLKEYAELSMKSVGPEKVVGASEVWVFNIKRRKLFKYVAQDGMMLTWKGTTLQNWDPEKSGAKTIRKPEVFFKGIEALSKRPIAKMFTDIKGVTAKCNGRMNEENLIVKVF
jgi:hypothetical protein